MTRQVPWIAWRMHRKSLLGIGIVGFLLSFFYGQAYRQAAGTTRESQAEFGAALSSVAKQFTFMIPVPVHPETLGGYEQYKWLSGLVVMLFIWAAAVGVAVTRGDEDRGLVGSWLAAGASRAQVLLARAAAFLLVLFAVALASTLGISAVAPLVQQDANVAGEIAKAIAMTAGVYACFAIAMVVVQLPAERQTGVAFGIGLPVLLFVVNGVADTIPAASWIGAATPFHWMNLTTSAAPGGTFDIAATAGLLAFDGLATALALAVFARRDVGAGLFRFGLRSAPARRAVSRNPMLRRPWSEGLWEQRVGLAVWAAGTLVLGATMLSVTKSVVDSLMADQRVAAMFQRAMGGPPYQSMLGLTWFGFALLLLAGYSVVQVSRWADQDREGRVEMMLSAPVSRVGVVVARAAEFMVASLVIVVAGYAGVLAALPGAGIQVDARQLLLGSALMWPFALAFGGIGVAVASRWPRVAVPLLAGFAVVEYFLGDLAPVFNLPGWLANLSIFHLYGNPIVSGAPWTPGLWMALVFVAGFAVALVLMQRRDVPGAG